VYSPIPGGSEYVVGQDDLKVTVYLPPEGMVYNHHAGKLEACEVIVRSTFPVEQYWEAPEPPENYQHKAEREKKNQETDPTYYDPDLAKYREREWHRRLYGVWFMNNGKMTYLTGLYYWYLTHWTIDIGRPKFRIAHMEKAYFVQYCMEDPNCYGVLDLAKRRDGKTYFGGAWVTEYVTRTANAYGGIQSKINKDAKKVFSKAVVRPFRKLIDFFRPKYDTSSGTNPKNELRFFETSKRGAKGVADYSNGEELESIIDFEASVETAYDGSKLHRYLCDEVFKTVEVNILDRHYIVKPCLEDTDGNIIGKAMYTSTVEEMEGHMELYEELWKTSDFTQKNKNGRTPSGLYRYFTPAQKVMYVDQYGFPDEEKALEWIQNEIDSLNDPRKKASFIRKYARNWKEAFWTSGDKCHYDIIKLNERSEILSWRERNYIRCKLDWDEDGNIKRTEHHDGKFLFSTTFDDIANAVAKKSGGQLAPMNKAKFAIGIDPYEHDRTVSGTFSDGAATVFYKYNSLDPDNSENFVCIYRSRPPTAKQFYEDMVKLCHYFGAPMLFENTRGQGIKNYFKDKGYGAFLMRDAKGTEGIAASEKATAELMDETEDFIDTRCHVVNFPQLIDDWKKFDNEDTTKYDLAMASGYCLMAASRVKRGDNMKKRYSAPNIEDYVKGFSIGRKKPNTLKKFLNQKRKPQWQDHYSQITT
jgi:hypothetical protein